MNKKKIIQLSAALLVLTSSSSVFAEVKPGTIDKLKYITHVGVSPPPAVDPLQVSVNKEVTRLQRYQMSQELRQRRIESKKTAVVNRPASTASISSESSSSFAQPSTSKAAPVTPKKFSITSTIKKANPKKVIESIKTKFKMMKIDRQIAKDKKAKAPTLKKGRI